MQIIGAAVAASLALPILAARAASDLNRISHIVVLYLENHSYDNLLGAFPGANGLARAGDATLQRDRAGAPYQILPNVKGPFDVDGVPADVRAITLGPLPNQPFAIDGIDPRVTLATTTRGLTHLFYTNRAQIHGGANDWFALLSDAGGFSMGYYSAAAMDNTHLWKAARTGVLFDNFFQGAFGGSFLNHMWFVCACGPLWPDPPEDQRSVLGTDGIPVSEQRVTTAEDGDYAVNTTQSIFFNDGRQGVNLLPAQSAVTIGDRLTERGIDWAWYSDGWNLAIKQERTPEEDRQFRAMLFAYHHQPFAYFQRFNPSTARGRAERRIHLRDARDLEADIRSGQLPPVTFYKPADLDSEHPGLGSVAAGDAVIGRVMAMLGDSPMRASYALIVTYDENGGLFDHVAPPARPVAGARADFFGPGTRIPTILISPLAQPGTINSSEYDTTSILKFIAERFDLDPLPSPRFQAVRSLAEAFGTADK
ncbi:MAG TPA: alkaline phosphatase family protein [Gemmatimonadales bacterium]|nr:alkaline phosphatase family protein [Gemmatimonadales bacterium]